MSLLKSKDTPENMLISYMILRKLIGALGVLLPVILLLGCCIYCGECRKSSISAYYNTSMRDIFVGTLSAIAVFLFCYKGYESEDHIASSWAGASALGVALFGTDPEGQVLSISGIIHYISAISFFGSLAYFCLILFTKTSLTHKPTSMKLLRNKIFKTCGYIMVISMIFILTYMLWLSKILPNIAKYSPVFWLETIALWAFGVSWMAKGEIMFADKPA